MSLKIYHSSVYPYTYLPVTMQLKNFRGSKFQRYLSIYLSNNKVQIIAIELYYYLQTHVVFKFQIISIN